jgi:hypothetical protein
MFHDLDATLRSILDDVNAPAELAAADVSFELPDKNYAPGQTTVNLFLHQVQENRPLRDPVPIIERSGGTFVRRRPPLRVDCSYIVTAWAGSGTGGAKVVAEHQLLGQALLWLSQFPTIPTGYLQGSLVNAPFPHPTMVAHTDGNKEMGEFWSALGQPPRPSFNLLVTLAMELVKPSIEGPPVVTKDMRLQEIGVAGTQERWFEIAGVVREAANPANLISNAQVHLVEKNAIALTNDRGEFSFTGLVSGNYTLKATKAGLPDCTVAITVPAAALNANDIKM